MFKKIFTIFFICLASVVFSQTKGTLIIVGGYESQEIKKTFVEIAGGVNSKIIIIPNASSYPVENGEYQKTALEVYGAQAEVLYFTRETADDESNLLKVENADAVFFIGGDQSNLTRDMLGTKLLQKIKDLYEKGGLVGGSSAGAAVMSYVMITGNELINKDSTVSFVSIERDNVEIKEGFGFLKNVIIDQHFIIRKRYNRLFSLMLDYPQLTGVGIDEATAIIVYPDNKFKVIGDNQVVVIDAANSILLPESNKPGIENITVHILNNGSIYDLNTHKVIRDTK